MALKNVYSINVDIKRRMTSVVPTFKQGDEATLKFRVYDNGVLLDLTNDIYSEITFTLPNGETLLGYPELVNGELVYDFTGVEMVRPGKVLTILSIMRRNTMVSVPPFNCFIFDSMRGDTLSYIGILQELIKETQDLGLNSGEIFERITGALELADEELEVLQQSIQTLTSDVSIWRTEEQQRVTKEQQRVNSESTRVSNEQSRVNAENNRAAAETSRTQAETNRASTFSTQMQQATTKINEMDGLIDNLESFDYSPSVTYDFPNLITYNGSTYMALKQVRGIPPTNDKVNYRLIAQRGVDGNGAVSKVNGVPPDVNGNVVIDVGDSEELNTHKNNITPQKHVSVVSSVPSDLSESGILIKVDGTQSDVPGMVTVDEINENVLAVAEQLEQIVFAENFKDVLETDDSKMWQRAIDFAHANNLCNVEANSNEYTFHDIVEVPSNVYIDLKGATIKFKNVNNKVINPQDNRQSWAGVFKVWGEELEETRVDLKGYETSRYQITDGFLTITRNYNMTGRWKVADASQFEKGDFVKIWNPYRGQDVNVYFPATRVMAKVELVDYDNNYIYTNYFTPFDYSDYVFRPGVDYISKVNPVENVQIKNGTIVDLDEDYNRNTSGDGPNRNLRPAGIGHYMSYNCKFENLTFKNLKFSGIMGYLATRYSMDNILVDTPYYVGSGEGYAIQNACVFDFKISRVSSVGAPRHLVDISGGGYGEIDNCRSFAGSSPALDLHGAGEHDIVFDNCVGAVVLGNSPLYFNDLGHNITFENCKIRLTRIGYYTNTVFINSDVDVYTTGETYTPQVEFLHCKVGFNISTPFTCNKRDRDIRSWFILDDCKIHYIGNELTNIQFIQISNYEDVTVKDCKVRKMGGWNALRFINSAIVKIKDNVIEDSLILAHVPSTTPRDDVNYEIYGNNYIFTDDINTKLLTAVNQTFPLNNFVGSKGIIKIRDNFYNSKRTNTYNPIRLLQIGNDINAGAEIDVIFEDNVAKSTAANAFSFSEVNITNSAIKFTARNNLQQGQYKVIDRTPNSLLYAKYEGHYERNEYKDLFPINFGSSLQNGYTKVKIATLNFDSANHYHIILDWYARHVNYPANGRTSLSVQFDTIAATPTVHLITSDFGINEKVKGDSFTLIDVSTSSTIRAFELYATYPIYTSFAFLPVFQSPNLKITWEVVGTYLETLPSGTAYIGVSKE